MALDQSVFDAMLFEELKATVGAVVNAQIMSTQNAVANQQAMNLIGQAVVARVIDDLRNTDVPEGLGITAANRGDYYKGMVEGSAATSQGQMLSKIAGNTPPVTP